MSDEDDDSKTEAPSARKLAKAWEEGQVPLGRDAPLVASLAAAAGALLVLGPAVRTGLVHLVGAAAGSIDATPFATLRSLAAGPVAAAAAVCAAAALGSALVTVAQTKGQIWPERWMPDLTRVFRPDRLTHMFSLRTLTDLGLALLKVAALGTAAWSGVRGEFAALPRLLGATPADQLAAAFALIVKVAWRMLAVAFVLAGLELALTRHRFMKGLRQTKQEAKREHREDDGDPLLRNKRKQKHRELSRGRARIEVPRADALVVNPTHIAIAIRYRKDEAAAPRVTAKGKGPLAEFMRDLARENAIPIVQDIPLARLLYRKVKVGREVPAQTYKAVATILAFVYRVTGRAPGGRAA